MIKELDINITGAGDMKGFIFTRISSGQRAYLYELRSTEGNIHYEVFKRKTAPICIDFDNRIYSDTDRKEIYPKSKHFGDWAWCSMTLKLATKRFKELENGN